MRGLDHFGSWLKSNALAVYLTANIAESFEIIHLFFLLAQVSNLK